MSSLAGILIVALPDVVVVVCQVFERRHCNQCYVLFDTQLNKRTGLPYKNCVHCRNSKTRRPVVSWRQESSKEEPLRVRYVRKSLNAKTGPIPVSTSTSTCPPSCSWYGNGCYAEHHHIGARWRKTAVEGLTWEEFCLQVQKLPEGQVWRHNEAGDLPGNGEAIDVSRLMQLVSANTGRRGFTYTHKPWHPAIAQANRLGFTINISCDSLDQVEALRAEGVEAPLTAVVPSDAPARFCTPAGHHVVVCPAQTSHLTCESCKLCAVPQRKAIIAFRAHGQSSKTVSRNSVQAAH